MKLKQRRINLLLGALQGMSGRNRVYETETGKATGGIFEPFAFPAQTKLNIAHNLIELRKADELYQEERKKLIRDLSEDGRIEIDYDPKALNLFNARNDALLDAIHPRALKLAAINYADLETAKVPPQTIASLGFLVKGKPEIKAEDVLGDSLGDETPAAAEPA
jgi:hypothetical protein